MKKALLVISIFLFSILGSFAQKNEVSQPPLVFGKPFIESFQAMYKYNQIDMMIQYTASESLKKFNINALRDYYWNYIKFSYPLKFRNITVTNGIYNLNYFVQTGYTEKKPVTFHIIVENDTSKILLDNLDFNFVDINNVGK